MLRGFGNGKSFKLHVLILLSYCSVEKYLQRFRSNDLKLLRANGIKSCSKNFRFFFMQRHPALSAVPRNYWFLTPSLNGISQLSVRPSFRSGDKSWGEKFLCCNPIMMLIKFHSFCTFDGIRINLSTENTLLDLYGNDTPLLRRFLDLANIFEDVWSGHAETMQKNVFIYSSKRDFRSSIVDRTVDGFSIELRDTSTLQSFQALLSENCQ